MTSPFARRPVRGAFALFAASILVVGPPASAEDADADSRMEQRPRLERVTTRVPFPRGIAVVDDTMFILCRGRVRGHGGVSAEVDDQAGAIYAIDPAVGEPAAVAAASVAERVRRNGRVFARPTDPPFRLWDRSAVPPDADRKTDRPYCTLRFHEPSRSFYLCAFSGIDRPRTPADPIAFTKNRTDAILRYDLRDRAWHEIERHDPAAGARYPHADPAATPPPHGRLEGPDNCLTVGNWLYAVAKDNSCLVRYDLADVNDSPDAPAPVGRQVLGDHIDVTGHGSVRCAGHSALAHRDGWLYIAFRTSSQIVRVKLDDRMVPREPIGAEFVAFFDPFDPATGSSPDLTDLAFDDRGRLYVVSACPARVYRFTPDPIRPFDARSDGERPWLDLAARMGDPRLKAENILFHDGWLYVASGDGYRDEHGASGTVYRAAVGE